MKRDVTLDAVGHGVFEIRLERPERMNALSVATCTALEQAVSDRALHMMLTGESVTSEYALAIGLVNEVVPAEELEARTGEFAKMLAGRAAPALAAIKRLVYEGIELPLRAGLRVERAALPEILGSADYAEGLLAFAEHRAPRFTEVVQ